MPTGRFSTASWRPLAASLAAAAALAAVPAPVQGALACEPAGRAALAAQADVVFTGSVERRFSDGREPAWWARPWLDRWPAWLPVPVSQGPGPGTPAVGMRVSRLFKGSLGSAEVTVRLLGRARVGNGPWTVFANRGTTGSLFTTECSGNVSGAVDPLDYGLPSGQAVGEVPWWMGAAAAAAVVLALVLGGATAAGAHALAGRRRRQRLG